MPPRLHSVAVRLVGSSPKIAKADSSGRSWSSQRTFRAAPTISSSRWTERWGETCFRRRGPSALRESRDRSFRSPLSASFRCAGSVLVGAGSRKQADSGYESLRGAVGQFARSAGEGGRPRAALAVPPFLEGDAACAARALVEGVLLGAYSFERYKKREEPPLAGLEGLQLFLPSGAARLSGVRDAVALAREIAAAVAWARDLVTSAPPIVPLAC